jgi:ABC-type polysaccharide/polyol phosphate transport system ATPase subunit
MVADHETGAGDENRVVALQLRSVEKRFRIPHERMLTLKQRVLHPRAGGHDELHALKGISFDVHRGEFFGIVGRNGSGKSTLLKCIAGIYVPDAGEIGLRGKLSTFIELGVGFDAEMTARDNVVLNATLLGLSPREAEDRFDEIIAFAELEEFVDMKLKNYSSGMHVRLAFSVAVHVSADVFLIDEVLAVGDAAFQQKCLDTFDEMRAAGRTIVLVTHDMGMVERLCDRAALIESGELISLGEPAAVARDYLQLNFDKTAVQSSEGDRWGDGAASVEDCWLENDAGERIDRAAQGEWLTIRSRVKFNKELEEPIVGFAVIDERGATVFGTNTEWDEIKTQTFAAGDEAELTVRFENLLEEGKYHISPAVAHRGGLHTADWRDRFTELFVTSRRKTGGRVVFRHETTLKRKGDA